MYPAIERRRHTRVAINVDVYVHAADGTVIRGRTTHLSFSGPQVRVLEAASS
jgi:hypothetical protein